MLKAMVFHQRGMTEKFIVLKLCRLGKKELIFLMTMCFGSRGNKEWRCHKKEGIEMIDCMGDPWCKGFGRL